MLTLLVAFFLLQYTGDFSFAIGAVSMLMNECQDVIIENITVNTNETKNVGKPTIPPALEEVLQLLCPNDCTFNGKCVNSSCVCNKDYTADDCSISIYQKPTITRWDSNKIPHNLFLEEILINFITGPRFPVLSWSLFILIFWREFNSHPKWNAVNNLQSLLLLLLLLWFLCKGYILSLRLSHFL